jgi:pilus assembly protein CpaD
MRSLHLLPLIALGLSLGACGGTPNRGLESVHQPVISRTDYVYDVGTGMTAEDERRLVGWFDTLRIGYGDHVSVDDPSGDPSSRVAVARIAARYGLLIDDTAPITEGNVDPGTFRVVVSRSKAEVPGCPDWTRKSQPEFNSNNMSNFGCATNANLAAMIADPQDLLQGRSAGPVSDAATGGKAIKTYRSNPSRDTGSLKIETGAKK